MKRKVLETVACKTVRDGGVVYKTRTLEAILHYLYASHFITLHMCTHMYSISHLCLFFQSHFHT